MSDFRYRWARVAVSALGILGFSLSALYVFAVAISFHPRGAEISKVMVGSHAGEFGWALPMAAVPYVLMVTYLFLRTRLGHWLLRRGEPREALEYVEGKQSASLLRSKVEVTSHRSVAVIANMRLGDHDEARKISKRLPAEWSRNPLLLEGAYWKAMNALRRDDLVEAHEVLDRLKPQRKSVVGDLLALRAELCAREGDKEGWRSAREQAFWARARGHRLAWATAVGVARFNLVGEAEKALEELENCAELLDSDVPGRAPERVFVAANLLKLIGRNQDWVDTIAAAKSLRHPDGRSSWLLETEIS